MMNGNDIERLVKSIGLLQQKTEQRQERIDAEYLKSRNALDNAHNLLSRTAKDIQQISVETVSGAVNKPLEKFGHDVEQLRRGLIDIVNKAEKQQREMMKRTKISQWASIAVLILSALLCVYAVIMTTKHQSVELKRAEWIGQVNEAVDKGTLGICPNGKGICAKIKGKWQRI